MSLPTPLKALCTVVRVLLDKTLMQRRYGEALSDKASRGWVGGARVSAECAL